MLYLDAQPGQGWTVARGRCSESDVVGVGSQAHGGGVGEAALGSGTGLFPACRSGGGYDPEYAQQLLDEVGGLEEPLRLHAYARHELDAHWIAAQLQAHGISVEVRLLEWDEIQQPERLREADMILFEAVLSQGEVSLMELYQYAYSFVRVHLDEEVRRQTDRVVQACLREPDEQERMRVLETLEEKLREEQAVLFCSIKKSISPIPAPFAVLRFRRTGGWSLRTSGLTRMSFGRLY